jgi:hypothetical protein
VYEPPDLPDLRAELKTAFDRAVDDPESQTRRFEASLE